MNPSVKNQRFLPAPTGREPLRAVPAANFARKLSAARYFPDPPGIVTEKNGGTKTSALCTHCQRRHAAPPGIVTEKNGERKHRHCARIDSGGTPPGGVPAKNGFPSQGSRFYGKVTVNRQPTSRFSTSTWPPRVPRICFTRASPKPLPSAWWELSLW